MHCSGISLYSSNWENFKFLNPPQEETPSEQQQAAAEKSDAVQRRVTRSSATTAEFLGSTFTDTNLFEFLNRNGEIKSCYEKDAGVGEGYSVGQHSKMVLDVAVKHRETLEPKISPLCTWNEFLLFLALHDIGKGVARETMPLQSLTQAANKSAELTYSALLMYRVMNALGVSHDKVHLFMCLQNYDTIGLFLKNEISQEEAFDNIVEGASMCGANILDFYHIFIAYHMVDAASYPFLIKRLFRTENNQLQYVPRLQESLDTLDQKLSQIGHGERQCFALFRAALAKMEHKEFVQELMKAMPQLLTYLEAQHKTMLRTTELRQEFKVLKKALEGIFSYLMQSHPKSEWVIRNYKNILQSKKSTDENLSMVQRFIQSLELSTTLHIKSEGLHTFINEMISFRRNYLFRYSRKIDELFSGFDPETAKNCKDLLRITAVHGANAGITPNLVLCAGQLLPFGRLSKMGLVLLSGEIHNGATVRGVNHRAISCTALEAAQTAITYASAEFFHVKIEAVLNKIKEFIETKSAQTRAGQSHYIEANDTLSANEFPGMSMAIKRLRALAPEAYTALEPRLRNMIRILRIEFELFKRSAVGYQHPTDKWLNNFEMTESGLLMCEQALDEPLLVPQGFNDIIEDSYPIVFGSSTLHSHTKNWACDLSLFGERILYKSAELGRDIQYIFAPAEKFNSVLNFLQKLGLSTSQVALQTLQTLEATSNLARIYQAKFFDFAKMR